MSITKIEQEEGILEADYGVDTQEVSVLGKKNASTLAGTLTDSDQVLSQEDRSNLIATRNAAFSDGEYFNLCARRHKVLPRILTNSNYQAPNPIRDNIPSHIQAYLQGNTWVALEMLAKKLAAANIPKIDINVNDRSKMPPLKNMEAAIFAEENNDIITAQYNAYKKLFLHYLLPEEPQCKSVDDFRKMMKRMYFYYAE